MQQVYLGGILARASTWPPVSNRPTLVFIHGSGATSAMWEHQLDAFSDVANTVAIDLPGHGASEGELLSSVAELAAFVARFLEERAIPDPIICGLSLGGAIALQLALDHAALVHALVLMGTGARLRVMPGIFRLIESDFGRYVAGIPACAMSPSSDSKQLAPLLEAIQSNGPAASIADFTACDRFDVMSRLGELAQPALILSAHHDELTPPKYADFLEAHITRATRVRVLDAGHALPLEKPGEVNEAIRGFIGRRV